MRTGRDKTPTDKGKENILHIFLLIFQNMPRLDLYIIDKVCWRMSARLCHFFMVHVVSET